MEGQIMSESLDLEASLSGVVQSQGIKIPIRGWLDIGSKEWQDIESKEKAAAYQAALICGWTDQGLLTFIKSKYAPRVDEQMANMTLEVLQDSAKEFPVEIEQIGETKVDTPVFKKRGEDKEYVLGD
jgi:hypothetical protein